MVGPNRSHRRWQFLSRYRGQIQAAFDATVWVLAVGIAVAARFEFDLGAWPPNRIAVMATLVVGLQFLGGYLRGLYTGRWQYGSFEEVAAVVQVAAAVTILGALVSRFGIWARLIPVSASLVSGAFALVGMVGVRYSWRLVIDRHRHIDAAGLEQIPILVLGAGDAGTQVIDSMFADFGGRYRPIGLLDDDPQKQRLRVRGVPVLGPCAALVEVVEETGAQHLVVAVPSAGAEFLRELSTAALDADIGVSVLPHVGELIDGRVGVADLRPMSEADLLGRREVETDVVAIAGYLRDKRVLVTGAGGSIGAELCRQIHRLAPAQLVMLDRDESALHGVQLSIEGRALLDSPNLVVADIRDSERMHEVFAVHKPEVVFHAAALKHLPLLEMHPTEGIKTNVWGTQHILDAALANGVERLVNISTDKAADPTSVLGYTKRIAERLTAGAGQGADGSFLSVRFGNVLGSRGSVLETFRRQIADGGPVTVTSRTVTRYFMTVEEAVQLVIQAGAIGAGGEVLVLEMGRPVRIADVARRLVAEAPRRVEIVYTGLRPGEKAAEVLFSNDEQPRPSRHPLIMSVVAEPLDSSELEAVKASNLANFN